jgi:putative ABC transport system substrate-binding protein
VDVIVVQGNAALVALKQATQTISIVMANIGDPVGSGFVASLPRPGGNITGLSNMVEGISTKWVELLKEVAPKATRLAVLWDPRNVAHTNMWREIQGAGRAVRVTPLAWEVRGPDEIERAFSAMGAERIGALIILPHPVAGANLRQIVGLATKHRLPAIYPFREFAEAGCLMSYGPNTADLWRRAAVYVDKILKGAKPADLPVEQPTRFDLVVNLKTAKALGLTIPQTVLIRATEVIEPQ